MKSARATEKDSAVLMRENNRGSVRMVRITGNPKKMRF